MKKSFIYLLLMGNFILNQGISSRPGQFSPFLFEDKDQEGAIQNAVEKLERMGFPQAANYIQQLVKYKNSNVQEAEIFEICLNVLDITLNKNFKKKSFVCKDYKRSAFAISDVLIGILRGDSFDLLRLKYFEEKLQKEKMAKELSASANQ